MTSRSSRKSRRPSEWFDSPRSRGSRASTRRARWSSSAAPSPPTTRWRARRRRRSTTACASCSRERKSITTFGPYSPGQAVAMKRMGIEGDLPRRLGDLGQGLDERGPGARSRQLSAQPGARRGRRARARAAHRRPQPAVPALAHDRGAARRDAGARLPAVHHRRRRHRPRRRSARAQPDPPLRRGRRAGLPHRGPAPGHQEVRPPGRQGAGAAGRADQAPERGALPARRHGRARHHRRPHRRRGGQPARRPRRRARPAVHPRRHQPRRCRPTRPASWR